MSHIFAKVNSRINYKPSKSANNQSSLKVGDSLQTIEDYMTNKLVGTFTGLIILSAGPAGLFPPMTSSRRKRLRASWDPFQVRHPLMLSLIVTMLLGSVLFVCNNANAAQYSLTLTISNPNPVVNVSPTTTGAFAKSDPVTISASTTNATGYTLSIKGSNANTYQQLINHDDHNQVLSSITTATTEEQFKALDADPNTYNNRWGYRPAKLNSVANTAYLPAPNATTGDIIETTGTANPTNPSTSTPTPNTYTLELGARVDSTKELGTYTNAYIVTLVAEAVPYTITYLDNTIASFPTDVSDKTSSATVAISNNTPIRPGYTFLGWCSTTPTVNNTTGNDTCTGTTYQPGANLTIDQTGSSNNFNLYALWGGNYTIDAFVATDGTMQGFSTMNDEKKSKIITSMVTDQQYRLKDTRDNKMYWVSRLKDGKIWMTQGLDLDLSTSTALNHNTSDIGWSSGNASKTWTPARNMISFEGGSGTTVSGWTDDGNTPYSASPYYSTSGNDVYVLSSGNTNVDTITNLAGCTSSGKTTEECSHYKVGNYYNFAAANATNSVSGTIGHTITDADDYTMMPDSICPAGWRLPHGLLATPTSGVASVNNSEFDTLLFAYGVTPLTGATKSQNVGYASGGLNKVRIEPLYFVRSGYVVGGTLSRRGTLGTSWSSTISATPYGYGLYFNATDMYPAGNNNRLDGSPVRCLAR